MLTRVLGACWSDNQGDFMVENVEINGLVSGIVAGCYWIMGFHVNNNNGIQEDLTKQESGLKCNHE